MTSRRFRARFALILSAALAAAPALAPAQPAELPAKIVTISGRAEASRKSAPWTAVTLRDEVGAGDAVRTVGGRLTLRTPSGQSLRLGAKTQVAFAPLEVGAPTRVRMDNGILWVAAMPNNPAPLEVKAGPVTVLTRGGGATIAMNPDGSVLVALYHGTATASGDGWQRPLAQDQEILVTAAGAPPKEIAKLKREKSSAEWAKWNEQQDQAGGYGARVEK